MLGSGVGLGPECYPVFDDLKLRKAHKYIIYELSKDKKNIVVKEKGHSSDYEDFLKEFPDNECRYAVYDFEYELSNGEGKRSKIVFFTWCPDKAGRERMTYATSKVALRSALNGIGTEIQGTDKSEIAHETVLEKVSKQRPVP